MRGQLALAEHESRRVRKLKTAAAIWLKTREAADSFVHSKFYIAFLAIAAYLLWQSENLLAAIAVFAALAYLVSFLEFPLFPAVSFLKLDFSNVFTLLGGFMFGPVAGVAISAVKEFLCFLTKSSTSGVGEIANFLLTVSFIAVPSVAYRYKKGFGWACVYLACGVILQTAMALAVNKFINFPLFNLPSSMFDQLWPFIVYFNLIKGAAISAIVLLLYKQVSRLFKLERPHREHRKKEGGVPEEKNLEK